MFNKRGAIGETLTWVVATLVIIVVLGFSIFYVSLGISDKEVSYKDGSGKVVDYVAGQSLLGYLLTERRGEPIFKAIAGVASDADYGGVIDTVLFNSVFKLYDLDYVNYRKLFIVRAIGSRRDAIPTSFGTDMDFINQIVPGGYFCNDGISFYFSGSELKTIELGAVHRDGTDGFVD